MGVYQATVYGRDGGGFVFNNVFHVSTDYAGPETNFEVAGELCQFVLDTVWTPWLAAICQEAHLLGCNAKEIGSTPGFTNNRTNPEPGGRMVQGAVGAVSGRIVFLPVTAPLRVSSMFVGNCAQIDFSNDIIDPAYLALLQDLGDAFLLFDGSHATFHWQLVQWHAKLNTSTNIDEYYVSPNPTTLNKRIRA